MPQVDLLSWRGGNVCGSLGCQKKRWMGFGPRRDFLRGSSRPPWYKTLKKIGFINNRKKYSFFKKRNKICFKVHILTDVEKPIHLMWRKNPAFMVPNIDYAPWGRGRWWAGLKSELACSLGPQPKRRIHRKLKKHINGVQANMVLHLAFIMIHFCQQYASSGSTPTAELLAPSPDVSKLRCRGRKSSRFPHKKISETPPGGYTKPWWMTCVVPSFVDWIHQK